MHSGNIHWVILSTFLAGLFMVSCAPDLPKEVSTAYENLPDKIDYQVIVINGQTLNSPYSFLSALDHLEL